MQTWFKTTVQAQRQTDEGLLKAVKESYLIDAVNFTEAEAKITDIMSSEGTQALVKSVTKTNYTEIVNIEDKSKFYKAKVTYISIGDGGKEQKVSTFFLINADSINEALKELEEALSSMLVPYEVPSISLTDILEVIPHIPED